MEQLDQTIRVLIAFSAGTYWLSWVALLAGRQKEGFRLWGLGWLLNAGVVAANWVACGSPPLGNMRHVMIFLSLCFLPLYAVLALRDKLAWLHKYFAFVSAIPLTGAVFMQQDALWRRVPALQSPWFVPHVAAYSVSYALAGVAFVLTLIQLVKSRHAGASDYAAASYQTIRLGFPFMTFGLLSGALWAEQAWGAYWSWDPKETWSLITWTLYVIYFHCRLEPRLRRCAEPAQILAFLALLTTFLLVNLMPRLASILHGYA